jgi:hypothetical protein
MAIRVNEEVGERIRKRPPCKHSLRVLVNRRTEFRRNPIFSIFLLTFRGGKMGEDENYGVLPQRPPHAADMARL